MLVPIMFWDTVALKVVLNDSVGAQSMSSNGALSSELIKEYLECGSRDGGKGGRPWNKFHRMNVQNHLREWQADAAFPRTISELTARIVDNHIATMRAATVTEDGREQQKYAPGTIGHRYTSLKSFVNWCVKRKHLPDDPLRGCRKPNGSPIKKCRILTMAEFHRLQAVAPAYRQIVYRLAVQTAFRQGEMVALTPTDLDAAGARIRLDPETEKTRQEWWFPLTPKLAEMLKENIAENSTSLLRMNCTPIQEFDKDCARANIPKVTPEGILDFHGLRRTAISWFEDAGATEAQIRTFGRHSSRSTTHRYRKPKLDDIRAVMLRVEQTLEEQENLNGGYRDRTGDLQTASPYRQHGNSSLSAIVMAHLNLGCEFSTQAELEKLEREILNWSESILRRKFGGKPHNPDAFSEGKK